MRLSLLTLIALSTLAADVLGQEWTRFRGPNGTGLSATKIPADWGGDDVLYRSKLPGQGHSSPILWGEKVFLTGSAPDASRLMVFCVDGRNGETLWVRDFPYHEYRIHQFNSFASPSAAVDAERVYVSWGVPERLMMAAFDHDGTELWTRDLGGYESQHGCGASPMVYGDKVILANDQRGPSSLIALDKSTGATVWNTPRHSAAAGYGTAVERLDFAGKPELVFNSQADGISGIDPETGEVKWSFRDAFRLRSVSTAMLGEGIVIGTCGSGGGGDYLIAVRPPRAAGEDPEELYRIRRNAPYVPTSLIKDGLLFMLDDSAFMSCADLKTGEIIWNERLPGRFFASPVGADDRIFCVSDDGKVTVVAAGKEFKILGENDLREGSNATPAIANGKMYVRTLEHLIAIRGER